MRRDLARRLQHITKTGGLVAIEYIELPGMEILHGLWHSRLSSECDHDCMFYETIGEKLYHEFCESVYRNMVDIDVKI